MGYYDEYSNRSVSSVGEWIKRQEAKIFWRLLGVDGRRRERWLEIGPGHGLFARLLDGSGIQWTGVELHPRLATRLAEAPRWVVRGDGGFLPFRAGSFDQVMSSHLLEHMTDPVSAHAFIEEQLRVLTPGGRLVVCAPDFLRLGSMFWDADYTHTFPTTAERIRQMMVSCGLRKIRVELIIGPFAGLVARILDPLLAVVPWVFLRAVCGQGSGERIVRKLRLSFVPSVFVTGEKP